MPVPKQSRKPAWLPAQSRPTRGRASQSRREGVMFELIICSLVTILPDYLYRRYVQGKRFGKEITFYSVWYELRWGITTCFILTLSLITTIFYYHPAPSDVNLLYRTVTILPENNGRVAEVFVKSNDHVEAGAPLFRL